MGSWDVARNLLMVEDYLRRLRFRTLLMVEMLLFRFQSTVFDYFYTCFLRFPAFCVFLGYRQILDMPLVI